MSAKRRQETIARFSVPLENDEAPAQLLTQAPTRAAPPPPPTTQSGRTTRQRKSAARTSTPSDVIDLVADDDADEIGNATNVDEKAMRDAELIKLVCPPHVVQHLNFAEVRRQVSADLPSRS